jgi:hypothetical protein
MGDEHEGDEAVNIYLARVAPAGNPGEIARNGQRVHGWFEAYADGCFERFDEGTVPVQIGHDDDAKPIGQVLGLTRQGPWWVASFDCDVELPKDQRVSIACEFLDYADDSRHIKTRCVTRARPLHLALAKKGEPTLYRDSRVFAVLEGSTGEPEKPTASPEVVERPVLLKRSFGRVLGVR